MMMPKSSVLSSDPIEAAKLGQQNLIKLYQQILEITAQWPNGKNDWKVASIIVYNLMEANQRYVKGVAEMLGQLTVYGEIVDADQSRYEFISRQQQLDALAYLKKQVFSEMPTWLDIPEVKKVNTADAQVYMVGVAKDVLSYLISQESITGLLSQQNWKGDQAYTVTELFDYLDAVVYGNFESQAEISDYQMAIQTTFTELVGQEVSKFNMAQQLSDHTTVLNAYLVRLRSNLIQLRDATEDARRRNSYELMLMRLDRNYFNKRV